MQIRTNCPQCAAVYSLAESFAGKSVRCKKCEHVFSVAATATNEIATEIVAEKKPLPAPRRRVPVEDERDRPVRRARLRDRDDDDPAPSKNAFPVAWLIGGGVAALVLIIGGVLAFVLTRDKPDSSAAIVDAAQPKRNENPWPKPQPNPFINPQPKPNDNVVPQPQPKPNDVVKPQPQPVNPFVPQPQPQPVNPFVPKPVPQPVAPPAVTDVPWKARPDPVAEVATIPEIARVNLPLTGFSPVVLYAPVPSPFVLTSQNVKGRDVYQVWDLHNSKASGKPFVAGTGSLTAPYALSPDGAFVAGRANGSPQPAVDVWATANGLQLKRLVLGDPGRANLQFVDFAALGQLVTTKTVGPDIVVQVWDIKTGTELHSVTAPVQNDAKQLAVSAGRKFLAACHKKSDRIVVYDLTTATPAGEALVPKKDGITSCQGLAFSPDGKTLAGLFGGFKGGRIVTWDMATGKVMADHTFPKNLQQVANGAFFYKGATLEWLSDGSGWFAFGQLLIDAAKGGLYFRMPEAGFDGMPRRMYGANRVAIVKSDNRNKVFTLDTLPADQLAAALKAVQAGEDPAATKLPAPKAADWSTVRNLQAGGAAVAWKAQADAGPAARPLVKSLPLQGKASDLVRILFAAPNVAQAAVLSATAPSDVITRKQARIDRYDLATGKHLGGNDLFAAEPPQNQQLHLDADLSPDGALVVVKEPKDGKRVDIWSAADGKPVAGWLPFEKEADAVVRWVGFLDTGKVLTLNGAGKLVLWQVPECKALWALDSCKTVPAISAGRKYLSVFNGSTIELLDGAGERQGTLAGPTIRSVQAAAFRPDGKEFAVVFQGGQGGTSLARWNAAGEIVDEMPIPAVFAADAYHLELKWCGLEQLMLQNSLIDLNLKWMTFTYNIPGTGQAATGSPDGRYWFAAAPQPSATPLLSAQSFPDDASKALAQSVAAKAVQPLLSPGMTVSVRVEGAAPAGDADFHRRVIDGLKSNFQARGLKVADQAPVAFVVSYQPERDTGKKITFRSIGGRLPRKPDTVVPIMEVVCTATLLDERGTKIWDRKQSMHTPTPFGIVRYEDIAGTLSKQLWQHCQNWGSGSALPSVILRTPAGVESLPKFQTLTGDR